MKFNYYLSFVLFVAVISWSCNQDGDSGEEPIAPKTSLADMRATINANTANQIIIPAYQQLADHTTQLNKAILDFTTSPNVEQLKTARTTLKNAWLRWQDASIYIFGPSESVALRKSLNIYPTNTDKIEKNITTNNYILSSIDNQAAIGFPAIDYLLNGLSSDDASIVSLFIDNENRGKYLEELSEDIKSRVDETMNSWLAEGGNYANTYANANGTDIGSSLGILVNAIDLHYQRFLRDGKIAIPAGVRSAGVPRPKATEAYYGGYSVELLTAGLQAYQRLFAGVGADDIDRDGIYDYLELLGEEALAKQIEAQFDSAFEAASQLSDPLSQNIENDLDQVTNVFLEMQKIVPLLKADMASKMGIIITNTDNDGD